MGAGALAATYLPGAEPAGDPLEPAGFLNYWAHWDGAWYSEIAAQGYGSRAPESTAFFPLYPLLVRAGSSLGGGPAVWGVLISLLCVAFALYFVYRIAEYVYDAGAARASTLALAFFPTSFFLNAVYTEALFLTLTAGAVWAARVRGNLLLARQQSTYWERELTGPLTTLGRAWQDAGAGMRYVLDPSALFLGAPAGPSLEASNTLNLVFLVFFLLVLLAGFVLLPPELSIYTV